MIETLKLCFHITRRNWAVYRKDFIANISPTVADPALIMLSLGFGLGSYLSNVEGMSYLQFLAPGLTVATSLFTSFFETSYGFYVRMTYENVYKAMLTTPIGIKEVFFGEMLWVGLKGAVMSLGVSLVLAVFGLCSNLNLIALLALVGFLVAVPCGAMGLIATAKVRNINQFQTVYSFIIAPLYFLSGIFFPIEQMAPSLKFIADFFPLIHGVRLAQAIFWDRQVFSTIIFSGGSLILQSLFFGSIAYYLIRRRLIN